MKEFLVRLFTCFIPSKNARRKIREKYIKQKPVSLIDMSLNLQKIEKKINDLNFKQNLIMDYFLDVNMLKPATGNQRNRQLENIVLLKEFVRICKILNLRYWLDYGSLLGAKRHGFTIPWDDDVDVSMPAKEFDSFEHIISEIISPDIEYKHVWKNYQSRLVFKKDTGAFLDIYCYEESDDRLKGRPIFRPASYNRSIPKNVIFPLSTINFEGVDVSVPNDVDTYLRIKYGNYLLLPKAEHIEAGHNKVSEYLNFYSEK